MEKKEKRKRTKTSKFGSSGREGHDSSIFYSSRLYESLPTEKQGDHIVNNISPNHFDTIFQSSSESMKEIPDLVYI